MDTGHLTLRTNSIAHEVLVDRNTGRARGIGFLDSVTGVVKDLVGKPHTLDDGRPGGF